MKHKTVLVTGANSGIGEYVVTTLLETGAKVYAVDLYCDQLIKFKVKYSNQLEYIKYDLTNLESVGNIFDDANRKDFIFDGLVHCAGVSPLMKIEENDVEKMLLTYKVNVLSFIELLKFFYKPDFSRDCSSVVTMTSIATTVASFRQTVYSSSKAALEQVVRCAAKEFLDRKIRVNAVSAGAVETEMLVELEKKSDGLREKFYKYYPLGLISPEEVSNTLLYLLSDDSRHIDGSIIRIDSGFFINK